MEDFCSTHKAVVETGSKDYITEVIHIQLYGSLCWKSRKRNLEQHLEVELEIV